MKILVTGGSGYLGSKIIEQLALEGHELISVDTRPPVDDIEGVTYVNLDIRDHALETYLPGVQVLVHCAALVPLTRAYQEFVSVNVEGSRAVARAAAASGVANFVHISSSAVFGRVPQIGPITRLTRRHPVEPYGRSKLGGEMAVQRELRDSQTKLAIVRPRTIIGPDRGGIFDLFFSWIRDSLPIFTIGSGRNLFQFVHVSDLIEAIRLIVVKGAEGDFNVGATRYGSLQELFTAVIKHGESKSRIVHLNKPLTIFALSALEKFSLSPLAPWHYKTFHFDFFFDTSPLENLGWQPIYSNEEMFLEAYDSYLTDSQVHFVDEGASPHSKPLAANVLTRLQRFF